MDSVTEGRAIGLAWSYAEAGTFSSSFEARLTSGARVRGSVVPTPFYDPEGVKLRV
jgi:hypothetical protein